MRLADLVRLVSLAVAPFAVAILAPEAPHAQGNVSSCVPLIGAPDYSFIKVVDLAELAGLSATAMNDRGQVAFIAGVPEDPNDTSPAQCLFRWGGGDAQAILCEEPWRCFDSSNPGAIGSPCVSSTECPTGGVCTPLRCVGGSAAGAPCFGTGACPGGGECLTYPFIDSDPGFGLVVPAVAINDRGVIAFVWDDKSRGSELYKIPPDGSPPTRFQDRLDMSNEIEDPSLSNLDDAVAYYALTRSELRRKGPRRCIDGSNGGGLCTSDLECPLSSCLETSVVIASSDPSFPDATRQAIAGQFAVIEHDGDRVFIFGQLLSSGTMGILAGDGGPLEVLHEISSPRVFGALNSEGDALISDQDLSLSSYPLIRRTLGGSESIVSRFPGFGLPPTTDLAGCDVVLDRVGICNEDFSPCIDDSECAESFPGAGDDICGLSGTAEGLWVWHADDLRPVAEPGVTPMFGATYVGSFPSYEFNAGLKINRAGQILTIVGLDDGRNLLVRAELPGASISNPVTPTNPGVSCSVGCQFQLSPSGPLGVGGTGLPIFLDPVVAIGYDYTVAPEDPHFASVIVPEPLPGGDGSFELEFAGNTVPLSAGEQFDFTAIVAEGVPAFTIRGIDPGEGLDPDDPLAFVTGTTFVAADESVLVTMTAITSDTEADGDGDGVADAEDNCPNVPNGDQADADGNGVGDACQCGDVNDDGITNVTDALAIARGEILSSDPGFGRCDVNGDGVCNVTDALAIARGEVSSLPEEQHCPAYMGSPPP